MFDEISLLFMFFGIISNTSVCINTCFFIAYSCIFFATSHGKSPCDGGFTIAGSKNGC